MATDLVTEMIANIEGALNDTDEEDEPIEQQSCDEIIASITPELWRIAYQMISVYREDNPRDYLAELSSRQGDWVREFLWGDDGLDMDELRAL